MTKRGLFLFAGTVLGACLLPGCLRPFGQRQDPNAPWAREVQQPPKIETSNKSPGEGKNESTGPGKPVLDMLLVPSLQEETAPGPEKKPEVFQTLILGSPDLTAPGPSEASPTGQPGPAAPAPPTLTENSEPPPGISRSDYPGKEPLLDVIYYFVADQPDKAIELLRRYDPAKQNIIMALLPVIKKAGLSQKPLEPLNPEDVRNIQNQLGSLLDKLTPSSELLITKMCFCKSIKAYAMYDPLPEDHVFRASSKEQSRDGDFVQVYVELGNFCCERRDDYHQIHLSSSVEIRASGDPNSKKAWFMRFDDSKQPPVHSRAQLHDYFCRYYFAVPHLPPGDYTMTIQVVDETYPDKRRMATKSLPIRVTAAPPASP